MAELNLTKVMPALDDAGPIISYDESDFRTFWDSRCKWLLHECESRIIRDLLPDSTGWFFDLGCGFGRLAPAYLKAGRPVVAVDYSMTQLEIAQEAYPPDSAFLIAADACRLPFRDGVFQSGLCIRLLHHIAQPQMLFREVSRVCADDACLVFNYMNKRNLMRILRYGRTCFDRDHTPIHDVLFGTHPGFFDELARDHGFRVLRQAGTGLIHQLSRGWGSLERLMDAAAWLAYPAAAAEKAYSLTFGRLRLALMQYALLQKAHGRDAPRPTSAPRQITDVLACPRCGSGRMYEDEQALQCTQCDRSYPRTGLIYDFRLA